MDDAIRICARLLRDGSARRAELPELDHPDVRHEVENRLQAVGLNLATSAYSEHVGIRLSSEVTAHSDFDAASNLGLHSDACALLVILWARLVLQKRTARDTQETPGQSALFAEDRADAARQFTPHVRLSAIVREFGKVIGSKTHIKALVSTLRRQRFLAGRGEIIESGPLLELGIDGEKMVAFIRREVLAELLQSKATVSDEAGTDDDGETAILQALKPLSSAGAGIKALSETLGKSREALRPVLKELMEQNKIRRAGQHANIRYFLVE